MVNLLWGSCRKIGLLGGAGVATVGLALFAPSPVCAQKAAAIPPAAPVGANSATPGVLPASVTSTPDYSTRIVGYVYDSIPITREELGEYLIARFGAERLELLANKKIIDIECKKSGIEVTAAEVEERLNNDLTGLSVDRKTFVEQVLKNYKKTLFEWKEDVLRPQLMLAKLVRSRVKVTDEDLKKAYDAYFGEKVDCRLIMWNKGEEKAAMQAYGRIRDSEDEFNRAARAQKSNTLASAGGKIRPISRNTTGNDELEKAAFSLQAGEVSALVGTPEGIVCIKCDKRISADTSIALDSVKEKLSKEIFEKKVNAEIPVVFAEMRKKANPRLLMGTNTEDLAKDVKELLEEPDNRANRIVPTGGITKPVAPEKAPAPSKP